MNQPNKYRNFCRALMLLLVALLFANVVNAQFNLKVQATYLPGGAMKKVMVAFEDQSVWVLSNQGKVYIKRKTDGDFTLYAQTINDVVADLTGFSEREMYFVVKPKKLIQISGGLRNEMVLDASVTTINNIAVVHGADNQNFDSHYPQQDWVAVATNIDLLSIFKGSPVIKEAIDYPNPPPDAERNWTITNDGFKDVDFHYKYPSFGRCAEADYIFYNSLGTSIYQETIPDKGAYPGKINCTLFDYRLNSLLTNSSYGSYNFWGTDQGLYLKRSLDCSEIWMPIPNQVINDLEEVSALSSVYDLRFAMAATNNGLYITPAPVYFSSNLNYLTGGNAAGAVTFIQHTEVHEKVNSIANELSLFKAAYNGGAYQFIMPCEKVVWLATDLGIKKLSVVLDQSVYTNTPVQVLRYSQTPDNSDADHPQFSLCANATMQVSASEILQTNPNVLLHWFKDGAEVAEWLGKKEITVTGPGVYRAEVDLQCETATFNSVSLTVVRAASPEITFDYPSPITICQGQSTVLTTADNANYVYRWFKDNQPIPGAVQHDYTVITSGNYRVEVSNCGDNYISSSIARVNMSSMTVPVIVPDKLNYCLGDVPVLKVDNPNNYDVKWYLGAVELINFANQNSINPQIAGKYAATFFNHNGCDQQSVAFDLIYHEKPLAVIASNGTAKLTEGDQVGLSVSSMPGDTYLWNTGAQTAGITASTSGEYWVKVSNTFGCSTVSNKVVLVFDPLPPGVHILNAFSPNGDGVNDYWKVTGLPIDQPSSVMIYNRHGQLVFTSGSNSPIWDGKYKGTEVAAGVYFYLVSIKSSGKVLKGHLTVIR